MPFDNCPEQELAPGCARTGDFGSVNGTGMGVGIYNEKRFTFTLPMAPH